jgi:outer membrane immunogenic protein
MKKTSLLLCGLMCVCAVSAVQGADVFTYPDRGTAAAGGPPGGPQFISPPLAPFWSGAYVGLNLGGGAVNATWASSFGGPSNRAQPVGVIGGGEIGYNYQVYSWIMGVGGNVSGTDILATGTNTAGFTYRAQTGWTATLAGRFGYVYEQKLIYAKGGVAFADSRVTVTDPNGNSATGEAARGGWMTGIGVEFPLTMTLSARIEYDYLNFASHSLTLNLPQLGTVTTGSALGIQTLSAGINFRF